MGRPPAGTSRSADRAAALRGFLGGAGVIVALSGLLFFATRAVSPPPQGVASTAAVVEAEETRLKAALQKSPDDLDARLSLARVLLGNQDLQGVWNEAAYVLDKGPDHPLALAYQALVRAQMGQPQRALRVLEQAVEGDPALIEAYLNVAFVYAQVGRAREMEATLAHMGRRFPDRVTQVQPAFVKIRVALARQTPRTGAAGAAPAGTSAGPAKKVAGMIELDPGLRHGLGSRGTVFVTLRRAGLPAGPLLAARRYPVPSFPLAFEVGSAYAMTGQTVPDSVLVEARLDTDGNPITRPPTDPRGRADHVTIGTGDVRLVLKRP
jgi:tetratricopeptide (TPR) repeat protein